MSRAIIIDPFIGTITETTYDGNVRSILAVVGGDLFDLATTLPNGDDVYIADSGLYAPDQRFFDFDPLVYPLAGRALIIGREIDDADEDDEDDDAAPSADAASSLAEIAQRGTFKPPTFRFVEMKTATRNGRFEATPVFAEG